MKRDPDLIRAILFRAEEIEPNSFNHDNLEFDGHSEDSVSEHALLMYEAGLIEASFVKTVNGVRRLTMIRRLMNPGHDMLAAIRDDTVWNRTKTKVNSTVGSASLEIMKGVAEGITKGLLGLS